MLWPSQVVSLACQEGNGMAVSDPLTECAALRLDFLGASQLINKAFLFWRLRSIVFRCLGLVSY